MNDPPDLSPGRPPGSSSPTPSRQPHGGWHCGHFYYRIDRAALRGLTHAQQNEGCRQVANLLDASGAGAPTRLQTWIVIGHKADFGLMALDPDPLRVDSVHQRLLASAMGPALVPVYSFVSLTEVSEYVPTVDQYVQRLIEEGDVQGSPALVAKREAYARRLEMMNRQRLTPELPSWPAACFYPMNKKRTAGENWFLLPWEERSRLMTEHGRTGMSFAGKVTQLITVGIGLEDWEWGVTLWAVNPEYLKDIVYRMRFDEASARYAEFGPFYSGYLADAGEILAHCLVARQDSSPASDLR